MTLLAQHGYGKGEKLQLGLRDGSIAGAVLGPRDETPDDLRALVKGLRREFKKAVLVVDPQMYASTVREARDRHLPEYPYYSGSLGRSAFTARFIQSCVKKCLEFQVDLPLTYNVAPAVAFSAAGDSWSQIAVQFAEEAHQQSTRLARRPLLVSLVFEEAALSNRDQLDELLDSLTTLKCEGFYLCVIRDSSTGYSPGMSVERLANLLYIVYALGEANGYTVLAGYADWLGWVLQTAGAKFFATGWGLGLRQLRWARFEQSSFGRQPRERYSSVPLLNAVFLAELDNCAAMKMLNKVLSGLPHDEPFKKTNPLSVPWPQETSILQHWAALRVLTATVDGKDYGTRMGEIKRRVRKAVSLYDELRQAGVLFETGTGPGHLSDWTSAIESLDSSVAP